MRSIAGLAAPFGQQSAHPGRSFELSADGVWAVDPAAVLVLEHPTSPHVIGSVEVEVLDTGIYATGVVEDDALDIEGLRFSIELAPWEMTETGGVRVVAAGTITAVALTATPAFTGTEIEVVA